MSDATQSARREALAHGAAGAILSIGGVVALCVTLTQGLDRWTTAGAAVALWGVVHLGLALGVWRSVRSARDRSEVRRLRLGWPAWALPLAIVGNAVSCVSLQIERDILPGELFAITGWATFLPSAMVLVFVATTALVRASECAAETRGVARTTIGATAAIVFVVAALGASGVIHYVSGAATRYELDLAFALPDRSALQSWLETIDTLAYGEGLSPILYGSGVLLALGALLQLASVIASFWLIPEKVRRVFWAVVDGIAAFLMIGALWTLPFVPEEDDEDVTLPAIALGITTLFIVRALFRAIPRLLDLLETSRFEVQVAARMLRAKKSGFLTAIGGLSILAVSFSSCTLATTLSVMGGFRADLQQKILGNHAHVVVDRTHGSFGDWESALEAVRAVPSVSGATPYVAGEVMLTSAIEAPGGAELRGIDPATIGEATDLPNNMRFGRLEYLAHPEQLLDLPPESMHGSLLDMPGLLGEGVEDLPAMDDEPPTLAEAFGADAGVLDDAGGPSAFDLAAVPMHDDEAEAVSGHDDVLDEIDRLLDGLETDELGAPPELDGPSLDGLRQPSMPERMRPARAEVLPGLVVGQELARSLRLHVGDEVTVVSPNGDLGPTGPIPRTRAFRIAGIFYTGMFEYDMQMAYTDLATAQSFLRTGEEISGIEARCHDWSRADESAAEVRDALGPRAVGGEQELRVRSWREVNRNLFGALELEKLAMFITLGIAILVASFCIFAALVLMVQEKGREVGILKAMGAEDRAIVGIFLFQGLLIGLLGAMSGLGLGYLVCFAAEHFKFIRMNPEVYYIDRLPVNIDPLEFALVGLAAVVVCVLATIYPAVLGSRLRPVDALRQG
ncbi:MAG: ABC transporter permease [Deltaproteobacteria bacterium]|nr:ABC transporter permease [Deltaproteobacteria bacterium]